MKKKQNNKIKLLANALDISIFLGVIYYMNFNEIFNSLILFFLISLSPVIIIVFLHYLARDRNLFGKEKLMKIIMIATIISRVFSYMVICILYLTTDEVFKVFLTWGMLSIILFFGQSFFSKLRG
jgi:purine-cytosine permease-like protein